MSLANTQHAPQPSKGQPLTAKAAATRAFSTKTHRSYKNPFLYLNIMVAAHDCQTCQMAFLCISLPLPWPCIRIYPVNSQRVTVTWRPAAAETASSKAPIAGTRATPCPDLSLSFQITDLQVAVFGC